LYLKFILVQLNWLFINFFGLLVGILSFIYLYTVQFSDIPGREETKSKLIHNVQNGRISHALMFAGPEGSGNLAMAWAFVQYMFCKNPSSTDSCNECPSCVKIKKLSHPDLHWMFPVSNTEDIKKAKSDDYIVQWRTLLSEDPFLTYNRWVEFLELENKQFQISTDDSAEIIRKLALKSYEGGSRVVIIWLPEKMNAFSSNRLLKILEEPPENVVFILVSEALDTILPTILSRVQLVKIKAPTTPEIANFLETNFQKDSQTATDAAILSEGNMAKAIQAIHEKEVDPFFESFITWMRLSYGPNIPELLDWVDATAKSGRENQKNFLGYSIEAIRKCLLLNFKINSLVAMSYSERENPFMKRFPERIHGGNCMKIIDSLSDALYHIERNGNPKVILLDTSLKISEQLKMPVN
jgi:DNA polymerase-3 subunit delta'